MNQKFKIQFHFVVHKLRTFLLKNFPRPSITVIVKNEGKSFKIEVDTDDMVSVMKLKKFKGNFEEENLSYGLNI